MGIDLGTSGVRIAVLDEEQQLIHKAAKSYSIGLESPKDWQRCCKALIREIPDSMRYCLRGLSIAGTSGTLLPCDFEGKPLGKALPYDLACPEQLGLLQKLVSSNSPGASVSSSLARALRLISTHGDQILIRHQADWIVGWLIGNWRWAEEGNNVKLGWDLTKKSWPSSFTDLNWRASLPDIIESGNIIDNLSKKQSLVLGLPKDLLVIAGTTDSNAAVLAAGASHNEAFTILGSTLVLKTFVDQPLVDRSITNHRVEGRWLSGGASNAGGATLRKFFKDKELKELSRQINPELNSRIRLRPLSRIGERFPIDDPNLKPILEPRPISDSLYLHALLEGIANIENEGWERLVKLGASKPRKIITIGGGAKNPQWRKLRERILGIPIASCFLPPAVGVARLASRAISNVNKT